MPPGVGGVGEAVQAQRQRARPGLEQPELRSFARTVADRTGTAMAPQIWMRLFPGSYIGRSDTAAG